MGILYYCPLLCNFQFFNNIGNSLILWGTLKKFWKSFLWFLVFSIIFASMPRKAQGVQSEGEKAPTSVDENEQDVSENQESSDSEEE